MQSGLGRIASDIPSGYKLSTLRIETRCRCAEFPGIDMRPCVMWIIDVSVFEMAAFQIARRMTRGNSGKSSNTPSVMEQFPRSASPAVRDAVSSIRKAVIRTSRPSVSSTKFSGGTPSLIWETANLVSGCYFGSVTLGTYIWASITDIRLNMNGWFFVTLFGSVLEDSVWIWRSLGA